MPLSDQERRCIELVCQLFDRTLKGHWCLPPGPTLDELHHNVPTPEVVIADGQRTAAVEVKRLEGDAMMQEYMASLKFLRRDLAPSNGGHYLLDTPGLFTLPMDKKLLRHLKKEIQRVAATMRPGDTRSVRIPRQAVLTYQSTAGGHGCIYCCHNDQSAVASVEDRIEGAFFLADLGQPEHLFATAESLREFRDRLAEACRRAAKTDRNQVFEWFEEWPLFRDDPPGAPDGVWVVAVTGARSVPDAVAECLDAVITNALRKFKDRRWADLHVLALERKDALMTADKVQMILDGIDPEDLAVMDVVLLIDKDQVSTVWVKG